MGEITSGGRKQRDAGCTTRGDCRESVCPECTVAMRMDLKGGEAQNE